MRKVSTALLLLLALVSCGKRQDCNVPIGETNFSIDPNDMQYPHLIGDGFEYFIGGNQGVVLIDMGSHSYVAYERTCPLDGHQIVIPADTVLGADGTYRITYPYSNMILQCPQCGSRWINTDGAPLEGSESYCYLHHYSTYWDYTTGLLYVGN